MKAKLVLLNLSLILYIAGLFTSVRYGMKPGAVFVLIASSIIAGSYIYYIIKSIRQKQLWSIDNLLLTIVVGILGIIFINGFILSIDLYLLELKPIFRYAFYFSGFLIVAVFLYVSIKNLNTLISNKHRKPVLVFSVIFCLILFLGVLSSLQIIAITRKLLPYTLGCLFLIQFVASIIIYKRKKGIKERELWMISIFSFLVIAVMLFKYFAPELITNDLLKAILFIGFIPAFVLPLTIITIKKYRIFVFSIILFSILNLFLIHAWPSWFYQIVYYGINRTPDVPMKELLKEPTGKEIQEIREEWRTIDFSPRQIKIEYEKVKPNGDTIKVISHLVDGHRHYGIVRIPKDLDILNAPILVGLPGGGLHLDILGEDFLYNLGGKKCSPLLVNFISIAPSYRGKVLKGKDFCFLSGGFEGDAYIGAVADAVAFLEVVKKMYHKGDSTRVLGYGVSKGATIALMIGGLTDKFDYIIANSIFSKFLDESLIQAGRIGGAFSAAFYAPKNTPENYRKRIITGSPYYFAEYFPPFEVHQGTEDRVTKVWHAVQLKQRLQKINKIDSTHNVYIYEGKGHGYYDPEKVCKSIEQFLQ